MAAQAFTCLGRFFVPHPRLASLATPSRGFPFGPVSSHLPPPPSRFAPPHLHQTLRVTLPLPMASFRPVHHQIFYIK